MKWKKEKREREQDEALERQFARLSVLALSG